MNTIGKGLTGKEIEAKYRFADIEKMDKDEILMQFKRLYQDAIKIASENEVRHQNYRKNTGYDPGWKGIEKVLYVLQDNGRTMASKEVQSSILNLEPFLKYNWNNHYSAVIKYLSRGVKAGRVIKYKIATIGYFYGLPEWFDDAGKIIATYLPNL